MTADQRHIVGDEELWSRGGGLARRKRAPVDLDRLTEVVFTLFAFGMYSIGSVVGAVLLGGWMGAFALAGFAIPPMVYVLVKSAQRKAQRDQWQQFAGGQERTAASALDGLG